MTDFRDASWWAVDSVAYHQSNIPGATALHRVLTGARGPTKTVGDFGRAVHIAVLEPDRFVTEGPDATIAVKPADVCVGSGKGQQGRLDVWEKANTGKLWLTEAEHHTIVNIQDAVQSHPVTGKLLSIRTSKVEAAMRAVDSQTGLDVRGCVDYFAGRQVADLKTTDDPEPHGWVRSHVHPYGYDLQAALYSDLVEAITGRTPQYAWLVVSKIAPHRISLIDCTPGWLETGHRKVRAALSILDYERDRPRPKLYYEGVVVKANDPPPHVDDDVRRWEAHAQRCKEEAGR